MRDTRIEEIYKSIDKMVVSISTEPDFNYIQTHISYISLFKDELSTLISEILQSKSEIEKKLQALKFEYEVTATNLMLSNADVKQFTSEKERRNYINYCLLKDSKKSIEALEQNLSDVDKLYGLSKKKSRDLDEKYKWLKTQWDIVNSEFKFIKSRGSDSEYINKIKNMQVNEISKNETLFEDNSVSELISTEEPKEHIETSPKEDQINEEDLLSYL